MKFAVTILVTCVAALVALGMVMLYSCSMAQPAAHYLSMQFAWLAVGLVACVFMASLDYRLFRKISWPVFVIALVLLVMVLVPGIGTMVKGARRWLPVGPVRFQPSEFAKLALIMILAWYCERYERQMATLAHGILKPAILIGLVLLLVFREPDRGTTILLAAVSGTLLLLAGVRWKFFVPPVLAALAGLAISIYRDPMRMKRIFAWLYLEEHKDGTGYQGVQAMLALGSGGLTGVGLGNSRQKQGFIPEHHTDFILSIIGEELGLIATLLVVFAFVAILFCGLYIAWRASEPYGFFLGAGISFLIGLQAFINVGVVTSALPNKGLPLPFISYGGSSLLMMLTCVGILLSIARRPRAQEQAEKTDRDELTSNNPFAIQPETSPARS